MDDPYRIRAAFYECPNCGRGKVINTTGVVSCTFGPPTCECQQYKPEVLGPMVPVNEAALGMDALHRSNIGLAPELLPKQ